MKRYWKIITLCLFTVIVIGAFYIQSSFADENVVIEFEKISGNENELESLFLNADYVVDNVHQSLLISKEGTSNLTNQSVIHQLTSLHAGLGAKQLIENYGSFMRGKHFFQNYFYEDDKYVAYANVEGKSINSSTAKSFFNIDILAKKTKETTTMKLDIPNKEKYNWLDVEDVQMVEDKLKVIARGGKTSGEEEMLVYTIDIEAQLLVADEIIHTTATVKNGWSEFRILNDNYSRQVERYTLFKELTYDEDGRGENIGTHMIYDIENNELKEVLSSEENLSFSSDSYTIFESTIYISSQTSDGLEVYQYNIESNKWDEKKMFDLGHSKNTGDAPYVKIMNGKIYSITSTADGHILSIYDVKTEEALYEGKLKVKNHKGDQKDFQLYIYDLEVSM